VIVDYGGMRLVADSMPTSHSWSSAVRAVDDGCAVSGHQCATDDQAR